MKNVCLISLRGFSRLKALHGQVTEQSKTTGMSSFGDRMLVFKWSSSPHGCFSQSNAFYSEFVYRQFSPGYASDCSAISSMSNPCISRNSTG